MSWDRPSPSEQFFYWSLLALPLIALVAYGVSWVRPVPFFSTSDDLGREAGQPILAQQTAPRIVSPDPLDQAWQLLVDGRTGADLSTDPERRQRAKALLDTTLGSDPDSVRAHGLMAVWHLSGGDPEAGRRSLDRSLELDPTALQSLLLLGALQFEAGQLEAAETTLRRAIEHHPSSIEAHHNLGQTLWSQGRKEEAEQVYRRKIELANARRTEGGPPPAGPS